MQLWPRASLIFLSALALLPLSARADILMRGDFETGDLSQWDALQMVHSDRLQVVPTPVREGRYSLRVAVRQGDDPIRASGNRNELIYFDDIPDGQEVFYRWSTFFPSAYPSTGGWQIFSQWHHTGLTGSPPVEFYIRDEVIHLRVGGERGTVVWTTPLERVVWKDFILQIRWSSDPEVGRVALWYQGEQVLPPTRMATRYRGQGTYFKLGLYRDASIRPTATIFHDNVMIATELEDVLPPVEQELPVEDEPHDDGTEEDHGNEPPPSQGGEDPPMTEDPGSDTGGSRLPPPPSNRWTNMPPEETGCAAAPAGNIAGLVGLGASAWLLRRRRRS